MTKIQRKAYKELIDWKSSPYRKPLIIRGARQVGKTTLLRQFAKEFEQFVELNLEIKADKNIFEKTDNISDLINAIFLHKKVQGTKSPLLIFIDEIQESPKAILMLRYFYEKRPDIHVIAAGSLLEFALGDVSSFPVGRVEYMTLFSCFTFKLSYHVVSMCCFFT